MITETGDIKIIDFGSAQLSTPSEEKENCFKGTLAYQSPEIFTAQTENSFFGNLIKSDVFILGLVVLEMAGVFKNNRDQDGNLVSRIANFQNAGEFSDEIVIWLNQFDNKFQTVRNEANEKLVLSVQEALKLNYAERPDFLKLFGINFEISSNEKLKFCILIEDEIEILDDIQEKQLRREKEQEAHPPLKKRLRRSCLCLLMAFWGLISKFASLIKSLCRKTITGCSCLVKSLCGILMTFCFCLGKSLCGLISKLSDLIKFL